MSAPPDFMTQLLQGSNGTDGSLYSPLMGLAAGLLQAGGPSRTPVSLGQALGQGLQTGQQFQSAGLQNAMQQIMLGRSRAYLGALQNGLSQPNSSQSAMPPIQGDVSQPGSFDISQGIGQNSGNTQSDSSKTQAANALGISASDPALNDQDLQKDLMLSNYAPDAPTQTAWLTRARLRYDMITGTPEYKAAVSGAQAQAEFPTKAREALLSQMGRAVSVNPSEGQVVQSSLSIAPPQLINALLGGGGLNFGGGNTVAPIGASNQPSESSGSNMSGIPTVPVKAGANGGLNAQASVYPTQLQKSLAESDAKYIDTLQTNADSASQGRQNIDEMWQSYQSGLPTGSLSGFKVDLQKGMAALGVPMSDDTLKQITNYEAFGKNQAQLGISLAKSVSQRPSQFEFKYLNSTAVANPKLQGSSIPILLSQMDGSQTYAQQKAIYVNNQAHNGVNPRTAALQYDMNASIMPYALQTLAQKDPASYLKLKQEMQSTATGRAFMSEIEKKAAWMQKNGGFGG